MREFSIGLRSKVSPVILIGVAFLVVMCTSGNTTESTGIHIRELCKQADYLFIRGELFGLTNRLSIVDTFVTTNLLSDWNWIDVNRLGVGTNKIAILIVPQILEMTNMPTQLFVRMSERISENGDMYDRDSDGSPNVYEIHNDTNPYIADFENAPKIAVPLDCDYATFTNALWSSKPYSIIQIEGELYFDNSIDVPDWPLLITGPTNGYAVIHSNADIGIFMVNRRQTNHTLVRNIYLTMDKKTSFQAGFWIGGNLPWSSDAAGATFENVRLRMYNPDTWYYGWHMYGVTDTPVVINNCTISAAGATDVLPVYVYGDSQVVITNGLELVNMPDAPFSEGYTWTGYSLSKQYNPLHDSDGDGINDYDEIYVHETDPYLKDTDGDRISDLIEIQHAASPTNQNIYCFQLKVSVTNKYENIGSLKFALYDSESCTQLSNIVEMTNYVGEVVLHGVVNGAENPALHMWSTRENSYISVPYSIKGHDNDVVIQPLQVSQIYDYDNDEIPDVWELAHGLSSENADDALEDYDNDELINLHEYWVNTNPNINDGSNTVLSVLCRSVDDRLRIAVTPAESMPIYNDYYVNASNGVFELNSSCWARGLDLSCLSVWNDSNEPHSHGGTVISKRHILWARHWSLNVGNMLYFLGTNGIVYCRKVGGVKSVVILGVESDINVAVLTEELPDSVVPVSLLSPSVYPLINTGKFLPVLMVNQDKRAIVHDIGKISYPWDNSCVVSHSRSSNNLRYGYHQQLRGGDSGSPTFLVYGNKLVLLGTHWTVGTDSSVAMAIEQIQETMDYLAPGYHLRIENFNSTSEESESQ